AEFRGIHAAAVSPERLAGGVAQAALGRAQPFCNNAPLRAPPRLGLPAKGPRMRAGLCSLAFVLALTGAVPTSAQQGSISGVVVATRTNAENRETVLLKVPARTSDRAVEEVRVRVGRAVARVATPALLPAGWQADDDGDELRLSGPALAAEESILARFVTSATSRSVEAIKRVRLELHGGGDRLLRVEIPVDRLPAVTAHVPLDDVIGLPAVAVA